MSMFERLHLLFGFRKVDVLSESGRAVDRYRRIVWSGLANGSATFVSMAVGFVSLPLTVRYLEAERYGLWVAIGSWISLFAISDLGIGNALVNLLSETNGMDDREAARQHLSTSVAMVGAISLLLGLAFLIVNPYISWARVFNAQTAEAATEASPTMILVVVFFLLNLPLGVVLRAYPAYQEGYISSLWQMAGSLAALVAVVVATSLRLGLPFLAFCILFSRFLVSALNVIHLFVWAKPWLRPGIRFVNRDSMRRLLGIGILYAIANIGFLLTLQAPYIVGPHAVGLAALGEFGVSHRLFNMAVILPLMFLGPLWPAYGEAMTRGDWGWVRKTIKRTYVLGLGVAVPLGLALVIFGGWIIRVWIDSSILPDRFLLVLLSLWLFTRVWQEVHSMLLNGAGHILGVAIYGTLSGLLSLSLSYALGIIWSSRGLAAGWVLGFVLVSGWLLPLDMWRTLERLETRV